MHTISINKSIDNGEQRMTSLEIAELTGKRHCDVMRSIRVMESGWEKVSRRKFALATYQDEQGKERPCYKLSKTETLYIATKFNDEARGRENSPSAESNLVPPYSRTPAPPIIINSGYRSEAVNKAVGGAPTSNHLTGCAVDIRCYGIEQALRYAVILLDISDESKEEFDELLIEKSSKSIWVHFAVRPEGNRRKISFIRTS